MNQGRTKVHTQNGVYDCLLQMWLKLLRQKMHAIQNKNKKNVFYLGICRIGESDFTSEIGR